jgi:uncharacterized membrane protein
MQPRSPREEVPWVVRFITRGQPSARERMIFSLAMMLALVVVALAVWLSDPKLVWYQFLVVVGIALVAAQARAIRWIDRNGTWADDE